MGTGFPFADANLNYCLILVTLGQTDQYPSYTIQTGTSTTGQQGNANLVFANVNNPNQVYSFIAYVNSDGIVGVGYLTSDSSTSQYVIPLVQDMGTQTVALAHNYDLNDSGPAGCSLNYNATFVILTQDYSLSDLSLGVNNSAGLVGTITSGSGNPYPTITMPTCTTGILIVTYQQSPTQGGIVMMPWGINLLGISHEFWRKPQHQEYVSTDMRQVMIGNVAYQAKLSFWSYQQIAVAN